MLDQNTDRMWYVIGAVLVGAAIILIANRTMPELFASAGGSFTEISDKAIYHINANFGGLTNLYYDGYPLYETLSGNDFITYAHNDMGGITLTNTSNDRARAKIRLENIIPYGSMYAVAFDVRASIPEGSGVYVDISDINEYDWRLEDNLESVDPDWNPYLVTVRHDGAFDRSDEGIFVKMNFVDINVMLAGNSTVELKDIVISRVIE